MTQISLATSLHLNHGAVRPDAVSGERLGMMAFVPVGLLCLKAYADQCDLDADVRVTELNGLINAGAIPNDVEFYEHIVSAILRAHDDLVGLMTDADSLHHTVIIADRIKRRQLGTQVCLGGPAASPMSSLVMNRFPFIDYVVRGEGEEVFADLIGCLQGSRRASDIPGLTWRDGTRVVENVARHVERDLDRLPVPSFDAYDMAAGAPLYLDVGRGCPFACRFCATAPFWRRQYRMKSINRIRQELIRVRDSYGRRRVNFSHDIFTCDRTWTLRFCDDLIKNPVGVMWTCSTRTDIIDEEVLERMAAAGCEEIYYGIETGSQQLQATIDKGLDLGRAHEIVRATAQAGIRPVTGFIVGYPMETRQTLGDTLSRYFSYLEAGGYRAHLFVLTPFTESPMYRDYGPSHFDRFAEYYDLSLQEHLARVGEGLKAAHPDIFASAYRYATPDLPARLVDGAEEISASLSMLRALWPLILPHYLSALDFYERWVTWIERFNLARWPGSRHPHRAGLSELLLFVEEEAQRLGLGPDEPLRDLVRYEQLKRDASALDVAANAPAADGERDIDGSTMVKRQPHCLVSKFDTDVETLLRRSSDRRAETIRSPRWVAVVKVAPDLLTTINLDGRAMRILEAADRALPADQLIGRVYDEDSSDALVEFDSCLATIKELVHVGLLTVAGHA